jgi:hypothetical protein
MPVFEQIEPSGRLAQLLAYWQGVRPGALPRRRDIDLMTIGTALLPYIFLVDVLESGRRFRWRYIGTHITRHAASDDTGLDLEISVAPRLRETIIGHYRRVVSERRPLCHRGDFIGSDERVYRYERLLLPVLADDEASIDTVFGGAVFAQIASPTPL